MKYDKGQVSRGVVSFIFLTILALFVTHIYITLNLPIFNNPEKKIIEIPKGMTINEISFLLKKEKIIENIWLFKLLTKIRWGMIIKAGEYQLTSSMNMLYLLHTLEQGKILCHKVTIPEGFIIWQIAELLADQGLANKEKFIAIAGDQNMAKEFGLQAKTLEGYLYPDTYHFSKGLSEKSIITTMVHRFKSIIRPEWKKRCRDMGYALHQIVTLASLIEKETSKREEKSIISAVYHNRLQQGIRLQCDPTIIYPLKNFNGNLTKKHLLIDSPYNTYRNYGLPPGPIANPGEESIQAALYPAKKDYRYFVSKNDGTHHFSRTLKEHNKAVYKYQKRR